MGELSHKAERAAFGFAIDKTLQYMNKDPENRDKALLKLVDLSENFMGDVYQKESYDGARALIWDLRQRFTGQK